MQEEDKKKELNGIEKLKEIGLKNVSNKTFINLENLTYLLDKDFQKLHKTKALGFIQILEREFDVDLSDLRKDYLYFQKYGTKREKKEQQNRLVKKREADEVITENRIKKRLNKPDKITSMSHKDSRFKIGPYLLLLLAAILGYYLLSSATNDGKKIKIADINNTTIHETTPSLIEENKNPIDDTKQENSSEDIDLNEIVQKMLKEADINKSSDSNDSEKIALDKSKDISHTPSTLQTKQDQDTGSNQLDKAKKPDLQKDENINRLSSTLAEIENGDKNRPNKEEDTNLTIKKKETKIQTQKSFTKERVSKKESKESKKASKKSLYIVPIQKAWVGIIYLDDYTKKDFLIRNKLKLNPNRDQLIVVGHNQFKIFNKGKQKRFGSKKMVRFVYQGGDLEEINKQEFLDRSAGIHW